jgi:hypothetical protein
VDEVEAVRYVHRVLRPGGVCLTSEPGKGHATNESVSALAKKFNVTEKDMPPQKIRRIGKGVGFHSFHTFPHAQDLKQSIYVIETATRWRRLAAKAGPLGRMALRAYTLNRLLFPRQGNAIVKMVK